MANKKKDILVDLLVNSGCTADTDTFEELADHLIANDVEPVVRCKNCKYSVNGRCQNVDNRFAQIKPDDYCSYGKRRIEK